MKGDGLCPPAQGAEEGGGCLGRGMRETKERTGG